MHRASSVILLLALAVTTPARAVDLEPCAKLRADTGLGFGAGVEYYAGLGRLSAIPAWNQQEHFLYLIADLLQGSVDVNLGLGRGHTGASNAWTVKVMVGAAF